MEPTVSIIVPVYNAERTIERCVDSVLEQEYADFELLLVDDGSQDHSGAILERYAEQDSRVRVLHKENTGVSDSRNAAIAMAKGTYLQFLDSDDWITKDATKLMVRCAAERQCDLVIADFFRVVGTRVSHKGGIDDDSLLSREEYAAYMMENPADFYYGVLWNKLYRRDIITAHHLRMSPEISWCEDFIFNLEYIRRAKTFCALQVPVYYYVKTKGSLVSQGISITKTIQMKISVFEIYSQFYKNVLDDEEYEKSRLKVYKFLFDFAQDGVILPLSGAKHLGDERVATYGSLDDGILHDSFRKRKLLEHYVEPAALKNNLTLPCMMILLCLSPSGDLCTTRKELAELTGLSNTALSLSLKELSAKKMLQIQESRVPKSNARCVRLNALPASRPLLDDLCVAQSDWEHTCLSGLSPEEVAQYMALTAKIKDNICAALPTM